LKSSWGNIRLNHKDGLLYGCVRKTYTRNHPYPTNTQRIKVLPREKAAIIALRGHGYPINMLSKFLGRSTSFVHRTLNTVSARLFRRTVDMRKMPNQARIYNSGSRWRTFQKYMSLWEAFIYGEVDKPP